MMAIYDVPPLCLCGCGERVKSIYGGNRYSKGHWQKTVLPKRELCRNGHNRIITGRTTRGDCRECNRDYRRRRKDFINAQRNARNKTRRVALSAKKQQYLKTNVNLAISERCRIRVLGALHAAGVVKRTKTCELLGCSIQALKDHLESQFLPGMTWENRRLWHVDHIRPCASFNLVEIEQQKACFHYTNLRPLWAKDNQKKHKTWQAVAA